ncbi:putative endo-polygalacturonase [Helianthus debilis subsp. tardiflorus]
MGNKTRSCHERERLALLEFKHSVKDDFEVLSSWVGSDSCSWKGVRCDGATGTVVGLHLRGNYAHSYELEDDYYEEVYYLEGDKVNTCLAELRHLQHLNLSGNYFKESQIPKFIGSFKKLSYLNLSQAAFGGIIPHHIGNLSNLKVLDLSSHMLNANDMAWVSGLSSLEHLDLSNINLYQANNVDMVFYMIPSLTYLSLSGCGLTNSHFGLHLNSCKIFPNVEHLDLSFNSFQGQLPHFFQNLTSLTFLDLTRYTLSLAWNFVNLLNTIPSLSELHLSECGLHNAPFSPTYLNSRCNTSKNHVQ